MLIEKKNEMLQAGWICSKCACPSGRGFDCVHPLHQGFLIYLRPAVAKLMKKGFCIESMHLYQLNEILKKHGLSEISQPVDPKK
jgi:hypothetical protein